ncbi:Putative ATPase [Acinetobacter baumannii]|nr:Putative ATPase [Acinetobacter baumannii]
MLNLKSSHSTAFTPSSPAERYAEALASGQFMADEAQAQAVQELDRVWKELLNRYHFAVKHVCIFITLCNMFIKS